MSIYSTQSPFPTPGRANTSSRAASSLGASIGSLPAVQQGLIAGELVQQWVTGDFSTLISVEHCKRLKNKNENVNDVLIKC